MIQSLQNILIDFTRNRESGEIQNIEQYQVDRYNASEGNLNEADGYDCPICKNKGFIRHLNERGEIIDKRCECFQKRDTIRRINRSGLRDVLKDLTFKNFETSEDWQKDIKQKAIDFCKDENAKCFYIGGQVGSGKSHICTAISGIYIKQGHDVRYMLWNEESKKLKALITDAEEYEKEIDKYKDIDVLYIDDFLKVRNGESPTTADINLAFEIINHRLLDRKKTTIISSEKSLNELLEYDEATMSRIYKASGDYKITIDNDKNRNYRLRGRF